MSKNIRILYLYIVSFITLCMMVGAFVGVVNTTVSYLAPSVNYYGSVYPMTKEGVAVDTSVSSNTTSTTTGETTAIDNYKKGLAGERDVQKTKNLKSMFSAIAVLVVSAPLFIYHWSKIQKERKEEEAV